MNEAELRQALIVKELEKIKAEIGKIDYLNIEDGSDGYDKYVNRYDILNIIDNHIAELKGETE